MSDSTSLPFQASPPLAAPRAAALILISGFDSALALLFPIAHPGWPLSAPAQPRLSSDRLASLSQAGLAAVSLHLADELAELGLPGSAPAPSWRESSWPESARLLPHSHVGIPFYLPQSVIHLSSAPSSRSEWPQARSHFELQARSLLGSPRFSLEGSNIYRSDAFWQLLRARAFALHEAGCLDLAAPGRSASRPRGL